MPLTADAVSTSPQPEAKSVDALLASRAPGLSADERRFLSERVEWARTEGAYAHQQGTRPRTLAFGLSDSPGGAAALRKSAPFGFRYQYLAGGVNTPFVGYEAWDAEKVDTYEVGAKGSFMDGRLMLSADYFYSDYKDFQARVGNGTNVGLGGSFELVSREVSMIDQDRAT